MKGLRTLLEIVNCIYDTFYYKVDFKDFFTKYFCGSIVGSVKINMSPSNIFLPVHLPGKIAPKL